MIFTDKEYIDENQITKLKLQIIELILLTELISVSYDMGEMMVAYKFHWTMDTEKKTLTVDYDGNNEKTINYGKNYSGILYDISSIIDPNDV